MNKYVINPIQASFVQLLVNHFPILQGMFDEHVADNFGELLPHLFFGDLTRYCIRLSCSKGSDGGAVDLHQLQDILDYLEIAYVEDSEVVGELIAVSFLEDLPRGNEDGSNIRQMVGPSLRKQLLAFDRR